MHTPDLDAVILAGGKSERLHGIVPPYHKPFLVVNGRALVVGAVQEAIAVGAQRVVVVATGENAMPIHQLVGAAPRVRVVLSGGGPGHALAIGLEMCSAPRALVLMGDNTFSPGDVQRVVDARPFAVGVRSTTWADGRRFTRRVNDHWVEGVVPEDDKIPSEVDVWCGPLVISRRRGLHFLTNSEKIGPHLDDIAPSHTCVPVTSVDVGITEVVNELTRIEK